MRRHQSALRAFVFAALLLAPNFASAASLTLAWDPEAAAGFIVSYGTKSGVYTNSVDAGNTTMRTVDGLAPGTMYYFVVYAYDTAGNKSPASIEVSGMTDGVASGTPTIECPAPIASSADGKPVAVTFAAAVSGGTAPVNTTCSPASGSLFPVGTTALSCTATDSLQMSSSCTSSVVVTYNPPTASPLVILCPVPSGKSTDGQPVPLTFSPTVTGGVAPVTASCNPASGSLFPIGTTSLKCTATDAKPSSVSCSSTAIVTAATAPPTQPSPSPTPGAGALDISCPLIPPVVSHSGLPVKVTFDSPTVTGGTAPYTTFCAPSSGASFPVGATGVTCLATDAKHQTDTCATSVIVTTDKTGTSPSPLPIATGTPIEFDGQVVNLAGRCPTTSFTVSLGLATEQPYHVTTTSFTAYAKGACAALTNSKKLHVQGLQQADGSVIATAITFGQ